MKMRTIVRSITIWSLAVAGSLAMLSAAARADEKQQNKAGSQSDVSRPTDQSRGEKLSKDDTDRIIANWLGRLDACEVELARYAAGKADVDAVNNFARQQVESHRAMLDQLRKFAPDAGSEIGQTDSGNAAGSGENQSNQFNWHQVIREMVKEGLQTAKKELRNQSGLDFDWAFVGQQKMIHDKMASDMKVLRKYASPQLREVIDDELAQVQRHLRTLDELVDHLKNEEYRQYTRGNERGTQRGWTAWDRNRSADSTRDPSGRRSDRGSPYLEEYGYAEAAFTVSVRVEGGSNGRAKLGVTLDERPDGECRILSVRSEGPAAKAGLQAGDVIVAVNGHDVDSAGDLRRELGHVGNGERVQLLIDRTRTAAERIPLEN